MAKQTTLNPVSDEILGKTKIALENHGITVIIVENRKDSLKLVKELIHSGAEVMTGSSTTLYDIGFMDYYLSDQHPWINLGNPIFQEQDKKKQYLMRRKSITSEYFIASVNAITQDGLLVAVDGTGSRTGGYTFGAEKVIIVSGINKIVPSLDDAFDRIKNVVFPLENERVMKRLGHGTSFGKWLIIENEGILGRITLILVKEDLGF